MRVRVRVRVRGRVRVRVRLRVRVRVSPACSASTLFGMVPLFDQPTAASVPGQGEGQRSVGRVWVRVGVDLG